MSHLHTQNTNISVILSNAQAMLKGREDNVSQVVVPIDKEECVCHLVKLERNVATVVPLHKFMAWVESGRNRQYEHTVYISEWLCMRIALELLSQTLVISLVD